jgi:hypothetical protein
VVTSALRFDKGTRHQSGVEQLEGDTPGSQDETENEFDVQVRIDRSIVVDTQSKGKGHSQLPTRNFRAA